MSEGVGMRIMPAYVGEGVRPGSSDFLNDIGQITDPGVVNLSPFGGPIFPAAWRGRYPHLMPIDAAIWGRFLDKHGSLFLGFQYDVTLGEGAQSLPGMSDKDKFLLWSLTVKRSDCLGIRRDGLLLVEVKPRLGMAAVGQVVSYYILWQRQYGGPPAVRVAVVCEQSERDLQFVCERLGVDVFVV
jgi:hypothetical protein